MARRPGYSHRGWIIACCKGLPEKIVGEAVATGNSEEREANALLIAAAPELLAALKALLPDGWGDDDVMDHMPGVKAARLAIAKAEGRAP